MCLFTAEAELCGAHCEYRLALDARRFPGDVHQSAVPTNLSVPHTVGTSLLLLILLAPTTHILLQESP
jgi:hypothetical protein